MSMNLGENKRPVIGIVPSFDVYAGIAEGELIPRVQLRRDYLETLSSVGAVPLVLNPEMLMSDIFQLCDGIVLSGGEDIDPRLYGQPEAPRTAKLESTDRFEWEQQLIEHADRANIPILGICYGMQRLNIYYGGSLIQDIASQWPEAIDHCGTLHDVIFTQSFLGFSKGDSRKVASRHHQAVGRMAEGFTAIATANDGIIEGFYGRNNRYGIQWHPESDATGAHIYRAFVESCAAGVGA